MKNHDIVVSVYCLAYNHERYINYTLDGFIKQKTDFLFEVIVHDDASTDGTKNIIKEYAEKYPEIIIPIYQCENQYSKGVRIFDTFIYPQIRGKYIAICEGDDYWTDNRKLQMQFDIMECNNDISLCVHKVRKILEDGTETTKYIPRTKIMHTKVTPNQFMELSMAKGYDFHTSSFFFRTEDLARIIEDRVDFFYISPFGDLPLKLYLITKGSIFYINDEMSHYRLESQYSIMKSINGDDDKFIRTMRKLIDSLESYDIYTNYIYHKQLAFFITQVRTEIDFRQKKSVNYRKLKTDDCRELYLKQPLLFKVKLQIKIWFPNLAPALRNLKASFKRKFSNEA